MNDAPASAIDAAARAPIAVVTGGARGLGRAIVEDLAARGAVVHVLDLDDADQLVARIKDRYEAPLREIFPC